MTKKASTNNSYYSEFADKTDTIPKVSIQQQKQLANGISKNESKETHEQLLKSISPEVKDEAIENVKVLVVNNTEGDVRQGLLEELTLFFKKNTWDVAPKTLRRKGMRILICIFILQSLNTYCIINNVALSDHVVIIKHCLILILNVQGSTKAIDLILRILRVPDITREKMVQFVYWITSFIFGYFFKTHTAHFVPGTVTSVARAASTAYLKKLPFSSFFTKLSNLLINKYTVTVEIFPYLYPVLDNISSILLGNYNKHENTNQPKVKGTSGTAQGKKLENTNQPALTQDRKKLQQLQKKLAQADKKWREVMEINENLRTTINNHSIINK